MDNLKNKAVHSFLWDFFGTFSAQGVSFVISIFLARILTPTQFGTVGLALVFIAFSQSLMDVGFSKALIQNKENKSITYSSIFFVNLIVGIFLFILFQIVAVQIGLLYKKPIIENLVRLLSIGFLINSLNLVQIAILKRELRFKDLSIRLFLANLISGAFGIALALLGWGVYALVAQNLTVGIVSTIILWKVSNWKPKWEFSFGEVKKLFKFSGYVFSEGLIYNAIQKGYIFVIGSLFSPAMLGFYTQAHSLRQLVTAFSSSSINKVFFPLLSKVQDDRPRFDKIFFKSITTVSMLCFFLTGVLFFSAKWLIITLFGEQWYTSVDIFEILIFTIYAIPINSVIVNAFLSLGKAKENFWLGLARAAFLIPPIIAAFLGGLDAFLWTLVVINFLGLFFNMLTLDKYCEISFVNQVKSILPFCIHCIVSVFITMYCVRNFSMSVFLNSFLSCSIFSACYISLILIFNKNAPLDLLGLLMKKERKIFLERK